MYIDALILLVLLGILAANGYTAYAVRRMARHADAEAQRVAAASTFVDADSDDLLEEATALVRQVGKCSTSLLQRKYRIGYGRAARLQDLLADEGVIEWQPKPSPGRWLVAAAEDTEALDSALSKRIWGE